MFERVWSSSLKLLYWKYKEIREENQKSNIVLPKEIIIPINDNTLEQSHSEVQWLLKKVIIQMTVVAQNVEI